MSIVIAARAYGTSVDGGGGGGDDGNGNSGDDGGR